MVVHSLHQAEIIVHVKHVNESITACCRYKFVTCDNKVLSYSLFLLRVATSHRDRTSTFCARTRSAHRIESRGTKVKARLHWRF